MRGAFIGRYSARGCAAAVVLAAIALQAEAAGPGKGPTGDLSSPDYEVSQWWLPGTGQSLPAFAAYPGASGSYGLLNRDGPIDTKGHPFFEPLGRNGRACVSCHQPAAAMSFTPEIAQSRWHDTQGMDPLFAPIDGADCPDAQQGEARTHSLILQRGLIRVALPWPPRAADGARVEPEFSIEVVRDPTHCNTSHRYGLHSAEPTISVYRRPRVVANLQYIDHNFGLWSLKDGVLLPRDDNGQWQANNIMADARHASLEQQAVDAMRTHLQVDGIPDSNTVLRITGFERQLFGAMYLSTQGGSLREGGAQAGPEALRDGTPVVVGGFTFEPAYPEFEGWRTTPALGVENWDRTWPRQATPDARPGEQLETPEQHRFRDSVARGYDLFMYRTFLIRDVSNGTDFGLGNPVKNACVMCHNMQHMGADSAPGFMDLGTTTGPTAIARPDLPLFKLRCRKDVRPHPYLGRVIYSYDPGRALATGRCRDIGAINMQQFRGLAMRAPYFANGSASTLREVVDFYDRRFNIELSEQDKQDLVNFLSVL